MTDENICYAAQCRKEASMRCGACKLVHYCSQQCQKRDWKHGCHKQNCSKYQELPRSGMGMVELREGRIPLVYALEHEATAKLVTDGILEIGYRVENRHTGERLTQKLNEEDGIPHEQRRDLILAYFLSWITDMSRTNVPQLNRALAKNPTKCHLCGTEGSIDDPLDAGGLTPDMSWAMTKSLCPECFRRHHPRPPPNVEQFDWQIICYEGY
eukprot:CAMPEP_0168796706 /NCGR_PEP_ID=MMETSP0725-20121227/16904_1 /TAXON_ID=265536 /ORGANISM="Amphiprora sp., Strain CCMP467" /LENGTH=211 /DNA_ID=CAMNT_0008847851 /DNA_START=37 /DNA_END=672 /DNA_ORIENTATION=-